MSRRRDYVREKERWKDSYEGSDSHPCGAHALSGVRLQYQERIVRRTSVFLLDFYDFLNWW